MPELLTEVSAPLPDANAKPSQDDEEDISDIVNQFSSKCKKTTHLRNIKGSVDQLVLQHFDLAFTVTDEIALEGLDGITLEGNFCKILVFSLHSILQTCSFQDCGKD